jgi:hypothetical protein
MSVAELYPTSSRAQALRERLEAMQDEMLDRMLRRGSVEPGQLPLTAGIAAALAALDRLG